MEAIWKWQIDVTDFQEVDVPLGTVLLTAAAQHDNNSFAGSIVLYGRVPDTTVTETETWKVYVIGTGNPFPHGAQSGIYAGTLVFSLFVWHVYVCRP